MSHITRARTGCWKCRERKVKCDEHRPICKRCAKSGVSCEYGVRLIWHEESLSKGICHGRSRALSKGNVGDLPFLGDERQSPIRTQGSNTPAKNHMIFLNTTVRDLESHFEYENVTDKRQEARTHREHHFHSSETRHQTQRRAATTSRLTRLSLPTVVLGTGPTIFKILDYDSSLLSYYEAVICSSSTLLDDAEHNPYRHLILPLALQSKALYHAILAVAAETLRISEPKFHVAALDHGQRAIGGLSSALKRTDWSELDVNELLALTVTLCWYEITNASRPSWVMHLNGIRGLIGRCQQLAMPSTSKKSPLYHFSTRYFAFHLVLARTAFQVDDEIQCPDLETDLQDKQSLNQKVTQAEPLSRHIRNTSPGLKKLRSAVSFSRSTDVLSLNMCLEDLDQIDPYMGFSNSLLLLINEVADLAWQDSHSSSSDDSTLIFSDKVHRLRKSLRQLQQIPPPLRASNRISSEVDDGGLSLMSNTIDEFAVIAEVNRLGALLLLHKICTSRYPTGFATGNQSNPLEERNQANYVTKILDLITTHSNRIIRTAALPLWPLFLAGCCTTSEEDRIRVMEIFEEVERLKRYGNVTPAREVVELVWRQQDLSAQDDRKRRKAARVTSELDYGVNRHGNGISARPERFEWERAMAMLGGWKLSLT